MLGGLAQIQRRVVRLEDIVPHEYLPFVDASLLGR
jgi:hypothetical protein